MNADLKSPPHPGLLPRVGEGRLCASVSQWLEGWRNMSVSGSDVVLCGFKWVARPVQVVCKPLKTT